MGLLKQRVDRFFAGEFDLLHAFDARQIAAEDVFIPADGFYAALFCGGDYVLEDVVVAEVGGAEVFEGGVLVVLRIDIGVGAAEEGVGVVLLLAVVGKGLAWHLASGDAAAVGEGGDEEGVYPGALFAVVEYLFDAFIEEGDGADLDADHLFGDELGR